MNNPDTQSVPSSNPLGRNMALGVVSRAIADGGATAVEFEIRKLQAAAVQELSQGSNAKIVLVPTD
ncbi:MAG: hypothetical protein ACKPKO_59460, partial [Candidatus Fonsibacter sp.]